MATERRTARRPVAARRRTSWDDKLLDDILTSGAGFSNLELMLNVADTEKRGMTVVRIIMGLALFDNVSNASGQSLVDWGLQCVSGDALAAGGLADPNQDNDFPVAGWLARGRESVLAETLAVQGTPAITRLDRDLRVMRKVERSSLVFSIQNVSSEGTAFNVRVTGIIRVLYKLP